MTHAPRFSRPAAGFFAAGLLVPLLFLAPRTLPVQGPEPSATCSSTAVPDTATPTQASVSPSPTPSATGGSAETPGATETPSRTPTGTGTPTETVAPIETTTSSPSPTGTATETASPPAPIPSEPSPFGPMAVMINEVAWSGTAASSNDEWIELHNPGSTSIDLDGWILTDGGDVNIHLRGVLPAYSFFLLERIDDTTILNLPADQIYTGNLNNSGETLELLAPGGEKIDGANGDGGGWPAGNISAHASMERLSGPDGPGAWRTFTGCWGAGTDANGNPLNGTPGNPNSLTCPMATDTLTPTPTATADPSPTVTPSPTLVPTPAASLSVLINEVAWAGTVADASDEWIELHNPGPELIDLHGWQLTDMGDLLILLNGTLPPYGFYLLERTADQTVSDIAADQIYTGGLNNSGESLWLLDASGTVIDSANADGGTWPAGNEAARRSMEHRGGDDRSGNWGAFPGFGGAGRDAQDNPIGGTPRQPNAVNLPKPAPTGIPSRVVINEVLVRPHYDWEGTGGVSTDDEFIELYNAGDLPVRLLGWILDDIDGGGSKPYALGDAVLPPHGYLVYFRSRTHLALNDTGDTVRLLEPGGRTIDQISYLEIRAKNLSYGRLPDGGHHLRYGLWPTAGGPNELFVAPKLPLPVLDTFVCPAGPLHPSLSQLPGHPLAQLPTVSVHDDTD